MLQVLTNIRQGIKDLTGKDISVDVLMMVDPASDSLAQCLVENEQQITSICQDVLTALNGKERGICFWVAMGVMSEIMLARSIDDELPTSMGADEVYYTTLLIAMRRLFAGAPSDFKRENPT